MVIQNRIVKDSSNSSIFSKPLLLKVGLILSFVAGSSTYVILIITPGSMTKTQSKTSSQTSRQLTSLKFLKMAIVFPSCRSVTFITTRNTKLAPLSTALTFSAAETMNRTQIYHLQERANMDLLGSVTSHSI